MKTFKEKLVGLNACQDAINWVGDMTLDEAWQKCERGNWMLWLSYRMKNKKGWSSIKRIILTKVRCARLVQHLMKDQRSINALDVAEKYANGKATRKQLDAAAVVAAYAADDAAYAADIIAYAAAYAAAYAVDAGAASYAVDHVVYAAAVAAAVVATAAERKKILKQCADICRETLKTGTLFI